MIDFNQDLSGLVYQDEAQILSSKIPASAIELQDAGSACPQERWIGHFNEKAENRLATAGEVYSYFRQIISSKSNEVMINRIREHLEKGIVTSTTFMPAFVNCSFVDLIGKAEENHRSFRWDGSLKNAKLWDFLAKDDSTKTNFVGNMLYPANPSEGELEETLCRIGGMKPSEIIICTSYNARLPVTDPNPISYRLTQGVALWVGITEKPDAAMNAYVVKRK